METKSKSGKRWTQEEDDFLLASKLSSEEIGKVLGRSRTSVNARRYKLRKAKGKVVRKRNEIEPADYSKINQEDAKRLAEMYGQPGEIERVLPIDLRFQVGDLCKLRQMDRKVNGERINGKVVAEYETFYLIDTGTYKTTVHKWCSGFKGVR